MNTALSPLFPLPPLPVLPRAATPPHNLPTYRTPLIGREMQVAHVRQMLLDPVQRLVTLVGVSGVGKTQVVLAAAQRILDFGFSILDSMSSSAIQNPKSKISPFPMASGLSL